MQKRSEENPTLTVPVPDHDEIYIGTLRSIIKIPPIFER